MATNKDHLTHQDVVHWYNQRGEHAENRIKELKSDFAAERMPCKDFAANAFFFSLCGFADHLFALMRFTLPPPFTNGRANTIRARVYSLASKVVRHGRAVFLKLTAPHQSLLDLVLNTLLKFAPSG